MADDVREKIRELVSEHFKNSRSNDLLPVRYGGSMHGEQEAIAMIDTILDGWWVGGRRTEEFESMFSSFLGVNHSVLCNSGSSALILAYDSLGLKNGDHVVSPALTFPTTINPAIRQGADITLVDSDIGTYNVNADELENAVTNETKAIIIPQLMGNMSDMDRIKDLAEDKNLLFIEDCCEALGSRYGNRVLGSFGTTSTFSFFPSHHISAAGGGMVCTNNRETYLKMLSLKNWGRRYSDIKYIPNQATIRSDYVQQYTYDSIGYNFNASELFSAKGLVQMKKLDHFILEREKNFAILMKFFKKYEEFFVLPSAVPNAKPSWFAFPLTMTEAAKKSFSRETLMDFLFQKRIETRYILCGNIMRQPAYKNIPFRTISALSNANRVYSDSFFIGLYPGINAEKMKYLQESFDEFLSRTK